MTTNHEPLEIVFYVHGVSTDREGRFHEEEYTALHQGIAAAGIDPAWPAMFGGAEWGWNFDRAEPPLGHQSLTAAQNELGDPVLQRIRSQFDLTLNPARPIVNGLRELVFFGFGDMFYYVSIDGKWAVRQAVAEQILAHINTRRGDTEPSISLTLLGHSAGSVIAFDFLYYLFSQRDHRFLGTGSKRRIQREMQDLRRLAREGKPRLRRLITFGSPISLLAFRSNAVVEILARREKLRPEDYGLTSTLEGCSDLSGARWLNLWDKDDPIAWPAASLMDSPLAEDVYVSVSDLINKVHNAYWDCPAVYDTIAERW